MTEATPKKTAVRKHKPRTKVTIRIETKPDGSVHTSWQPADRLVDIISSIEQGLGVPNDTTFAERMGASAVVFLANWIQAIEQQALAKRQAANAPAYGGELKYS